MKRTVPCGTDASGVEPRQPATPKTDAELTRAELWSAGKSLLREQGMPQAQCGTFVGKLVKDFGDEVVVEAVRAAVVERPADAATWLIAACKRGKAGRNQPITGERQIAESLAKAERVRASMSGTATATQPTEFIDG